MIPKELWSVCRSEEAPNLHGREGLIGGDSKGGLVAVQITIIVIRKINDDLLDNLAELGGEDGFYRVSGGISCLA